MSTIKEELSILKTILDLLKQVTNEDDFVGKSDIDSRLRWSAKNIADKIFHLSNLNG
jgi:hypothetical protein